MEQKEKPVLPVKRSSVQRNYRIRMPRTCRAYSEWKSTEAAAPGFSYYRKMEDFL